MGFLTAQMSLMIVDPEVLQSGFGVNSFLFWSGEFSENCLQISQRILPASFFPRICHPCFSRASGPQKMQAQPSRPKLLAFPTNFTLLNLLMREISDWPPAFWPRNSHLWRKSTTIGDTIIILSTQKITYTETLVGELTSEILHIFLLICPWSELISAICAFLCLEHIQTELHISLSGELSFCKSAIKLHKWPQNDLFKQYFPRLQYIALFWGIVSDGSCYNRFCRITFLGGGGVIIYCNVMIGAVLSWKPWMNPLQLLFLFLCCMGTTVKTTGCHSTVFFGIIPN